jgi:hypothetical protein
MNSQASIVDGFIIILIFTKLSFQNYYIKEKGSRKRIRSVNNVKESLFSFPWTAVYAINF